MHMRIQLMLSPRPSLCAALVAAKIPQQSFSITNHAVFLQVPVRFSAIGVGVVPVPELRLSGQRWEGHQNNQTTPRLAVLFNSTENLLVGACGAGGLFVLQGHDGDSDAFVPSDNGVSVHLRKRALHAAGAHVCCGRYRTRSLAVC